MAINEEIVVQLRAEIGQLKTKLQEATDSISKFGQDSATKFKQPINPIKELGSSIKNLIVGYVSLQAAAQLVGKAFTQSIKLDSVKSSMAAVLGSTELAEAKLQEISNTADYLGLNFLDLATSYKSFAAAAITSNQTLADTDKIFNSVTKAAATLKLSSEDVKGALNALGQMFSKGSVQSEELKQQLGERLPGAVALMAAGLGVNTKALMKMLEQGKVTTAAVVKLAGQLDIAYGDKIKSKVDSLQGSIQRLDNTFTKAIDAGAIGKFFKFWIDGVNGLLKGLENAVKLISNLGLNLDEIDFNSRIGNYTALIDRINATKLDPQDNKSLIQQQGELNAAIDENIHLFYAAEKIYGSNAKFVKDLDNQYKSLKARLQQVSALIKDPNAEPPIDPDTIAGLTEKIKQLKEESLTLKDQPLFNKGQEIDSAQKQLDHLQATLKGFESGDVGMIEISIGYLQDELKRLKPGDIESYKLITDYIRELQDEIDNVDPSSINWVTREIGRLEDEAAKLPAGAKEIQNLKDKIVELTATKKAFDDFFRVPPIGLYNTLQQELTDLQEAQKEATDKKGWDALQTKIKAVESQLESLTVTTYTNAEAFKTIWQDAFAGFIQGTQGAFEQALWSGKNFTQNFKEAFLQMIKAMIAKLAAALVMALLLSVVLGGLGLGSISAGAQILGMTGVTNFGTLLGSTLGSNIGGRVAMPTAGVSNSGQVAFEIQGDKLVGVLQNYNGRLNRLV